MPARSKACVCGRSLAGIVVRISLGTKCLCLVSDVWYQVEVSVSGWSLVQRSPTECGVSERDHESSTMRRPWPTGGCCDVGEKIKVVIWISMFHSAFFNSIIDKTPTQTKHNCFERLCSNHGQNFTFYWLRFLGYFWSLKSKYYLTLILLTWSIEWAPNNSNTWQMGFNSGLKGLICNTKLHILLSRRLCL
jgi:hypothetical protein